LCPPAGADAGFVKFWETYPRKEAKQSALKAWAKLKPDPATIERIIASVTARTDSPEWRKDNGQFIPLPASFLNGRRFDDELTPQRPSSSDDWRVAL
jgi:hypothetical protein